MAGTSATCSQLEPKPQTNDSIPLAPMSRWLPRSFPRFKTRRLDRCRIGIFRIGGPQEGVLGPAVCVVPGPHLLTTFDALVRSRMRNGGVVPTDPIHGAAHAAFLHFGCGIHGTFPIVRSVRKIVRGHLTKTSVWPPANNIYHKAPIRPSLSVVPIDGKQAPSLLRLPQSCCHFWLTASRSARLAPTSDDGDRKGRTAPNGV